MIALLEKLWKGRMRRPYRLARQLDQGEGTPVIFLHGIGRSGEVWRHVIEKLAPLPVRTIAFDLLGFGSSPKPEWLNYDTDDHARAVLASIKALHLRAPVVLVGHSMGCLVAVRVARLAPDLVKHLVLYEMPLYQGLPEKRRYRLRLEIYRALYSRIIRYKPTFTVENRRLVERMAHKVVGFEVPEESWQPFVKSLQRTIMEQTTGDDIKQLSMPMDVIYGRRDMLVIRGKVRDIFGEDVSNITAHTIRERHIISRRAAGFLSERIIAAIGASSYH